MNPNFYILCVDDDPLVLRSLKNELAQSLGQDYRLEFAASGPEALDLAEDLWKDGAEPQVILCDFFMPEMTGDQILEALGRKFPRAKNILLTGQAGVEDLGRTVNKAGLYRFVPKPWQREDLALTLKQAAKAHEMELLVHQQHVQLVELTQTLELKVAERTQDLIHRHQALKLRVGELMSLNQLARNLAQTQEPGTLAQTLETSLSQLLAWDGLFTTPQALEIPLSRWPFLAIPGALLSEWDRRSAGLLVLAHKTEDPVLYNYLRVQGLSSLLVVPLNLRNYHGGLLVLARSQGAGEFAPYDLGLVETAVSLWKGTRDTLDLLAREQSSRRAAEEANTAKSRFLASMSHEIRTPMGAILGFSNLLLGDPDLSAPHREHLAIIHSSGKHLMDLINDILDMSKIEAGKIVVKHQNFDLVRTLEGIKGMFYLQYYKKGLHFGLSIGEGFPESVQGDESKISQILMNLVNNSLKFTVAGGVDLQAHWDPRTQRVQITLTDTGPGIPKDHRDHIFEAFYQAPGVSGEGLGLGLAISQRLAQTMNGTLDFTTGPQGTTFVLEIPLVPGERLEHRSEPSPDQKVLGLVGGTPAFRTLVLETDPGRFAQLETWLLRIGFPVRQVQTCEQALDTAATWKPDLIFAACPAQDLPGTLTTLRTLTPGQTPLVILTTPPDPALVMDPPVPFLSHPWTEYEFYRLLGPLLGLEYTYSPKPSGVQLLTPLAMKNLPGQTRYKLRTGALAKNPEYVETIINGFPKELRAWQDPLRALVHQQNWARLLELLE